MLQDAIVAFVPRIRGYKLQRVDTWDLVRTSLGVGIPVSLALGFVRADRRARRKTEARAAEVKKRGVVVRETNDLSPGPATFCVRVVASDGRRTSIGTSIENPNELSGEPVLTTEAFEIEIVWGGRFAIEAGKPLKVNAFAGAHRTLVDSVTTESGKVEQRFSFEVPGADTFMLSCVVPERAGGDGPFRGTAMHLEPGERFVINPKPSIPQHDGPGCLVYPVLAVAAGLPFIDMDSGIVWTLAGYVVWGLAVVVGMLGWAMTD